MSAPITRAFMEALAVRLDEWGATPNGRQIAIEIRKTLAAESASPSCAPGASAHLDGEGVESGPGQPIDSGVVDKAVAWDQCQRSHQRGFRAGIEAAANWHDKEAIAHYGQTDTRQADWHAFCAAAIRALADGPAPDPKETKSCE